MNPIVDLSSLLGRYAVEERGYGSPCWIWQGAIKSTGYGEYSRAGRHGQSAHRLFYEAHRGPIPDGRELDHLCKVLACVNPDHLEPVTHRENMLRGSAVRLSDGDAARIQGLRRAGRNLHEIQVEYPTVSQSHLSRVSRGIRSGRT